MGVLKLIGLTFISLFIMQQTVGAVGVNDSLCATARKDVKTGRIQELPAVCKDDASTSTSNPLTGRDGVVTKAVQIFAIVVGIAAVIVIILSGLRFVLSSGDAANITNAKNGLLYAIVGLVIAAFAQAIVSLVLSNI